MSKTINLFETGSAEPTQEADSSSQESFEERMKRAGENTRIIAKSRTTSSLVQNAQELIIEMCAIQPETEEPLWRRFQSYPEWKWVEHEIFESWVMAGPWKGIGMTIEDLKLIASGNKDCEIAIDKATDRGPGSNLGSNNPFGCKGKGTNVDNIHISSIPKETIGRPDGTSRARALRKLRTEAEKSPKVEAIYQQVLADKISCHAAMLQAGFRRPSKTYIGTPIERAIKALKDCSDQELDIIIGKLLKLRKAS